VAAHSCCVAAALDDAREVLNRFFGYPDFRPAQLPVIESVLGSGHAIGGAAYVFATIEAPGVVSHGLLGRIAFGELDGRRTPRVEHLLAAFERAQIPAELLPSLTASLGDALWCAFLTGLVLMLLAVGASFFMARESTGESSGQNGKSI